MPDAPQQVADDTQQLLVFIAQALAKAVNGSESGMVDLMDACGAKVATALLAAERRGRVAGLRNQVAMPDFPQQDMVALTGCKHGKAAGFCTECAFERGRVAGLREAAKAVEEEAKHAMWWTVADTLTYRADALEGGTPSATVQPEGESHAP